MQKQSQSPAWAQFRGLSALQGDVLLQSRAWLRVSQASLAEVKVCALVMANRDVLHRPVAGPNDRHPPLTSRRLSLRCLMETNYVVCKVSCSPFRSLADLLMRRAVLLQIRGRCRIVFLSKAYSTSGRLFRLVWRQCRGRALTLRLRTVFLFVSHCPWHGSGLVCRPNSVVPLWARRS